MRGGNVDVLGMYEVHNQKGAKTFKGDLSSHLIYLGYSIVDF